LNPLRASTSSSFLSCSGVVAGPIPT
jgi:hypothetical protein